MNTESASADLIKQLKDDISLLEKENEFYKRYRLLAEEAIEAAEFDQWSYNAETGERYGGFNIFKSLGYTLEESPKDLEGLFKVVHPDDINNLNKNIYEHLEGKTVNYQTEFRVKNKNGEWEWIGNYGRVIERNSSGVVTKFVGLTFNINKRRIIEEELRDNQRRLTELNSMKDKLLSIIAHDLKNPIGSILNFSKLIAEAVNANDSESALVYNTIVDSTILRTNELLNNLLQWAQIQTESISVNNQIFGMRFLVDEVFNLLKTQAVHKQIGLINKISEEVIIKTDKNLLEIVIRNLVSNSIKFTRKNGTIIVESFPNDHNLTIKISDTGIGIEQTLLDKLFELSGKSEVGTEGEKGTGLGLLICKDLIEKLNGRIKVNSILGKGSEFLIELPV